MSAWLDQGSRAPVLPLLSRKKSCPEVANLSTLYLPESLPETLNVSPLRMTIDLDYGLCLIPRPLQFFLCSLFVLHLLISQT